MTCAIGFLPDRHARETSVNDPWIQATSVAPADLRDATLQLHWATQFIARDWALAIPLRLSIPLTRGGTGVESGLGIAGAEVEVVRGYERTTLGRSDAQGHLSCTTEDLQGAE